MVVVVLLILIGKRLIGFLRMVLMFLFLKIMVLGVLFMPKDLIMVFGIAILFLLLILKHPPFFLHLKQIFKPKPLNPHFLL